MSRLKFLTLFTVSVLIGIIGLQLYWLKISYQDQKARFTTAVEDAVYATEMNAQFALAIKGSKGKKGKPLNIDSISSLVKKIAKSDIRRLRETIIDTLASRPIPVTKKYFLYMDMNKSGDLQSRGNGKPSGAASGSLLKMYANEFHKELNKRAIYTPFELAFIDEGHQVRLATCTVNAFVKIPVKSSLNGMLMLPEGYGIQAAFPDTNLYLIRRMAWILSVTSLLIIIGSISLTFLLLLFFRQKRNADIRNEFMNNMTHELKTPTSSVSVALEMVLDPRHDLSEEKKVHYLRTAQGELNRLNSLIENVLNISLFEKNEIKIVREPILVKPWLDQIKDSLAPVLAMRNASLAIDVKPELLVVQGDKTHLTNILLNLTENALKYNDKEVPAISISVLGEGEQIRFAIQDNGKGIQAKYLNKIFENFYRVPTGDRHDTKGYGLGLSYVKAVAELHGGTVFAQSEYGLGSTFTFILPIKKTS